MGDLLGALVAILLFLLIAPIVILVVLAALAVAGLGVAIGLVFTLLGIFIELVIAAAPLLLIVGLLYLIFRPSPKREVANQ